MALPPYQYQTYGGYNPSTYLPAPNYPQQPIQAPAQPQTNMGGVSGQPGYLCRPVTSRLEAEAVQVDFLGPGTVMPDLGHGAVYIKRFNPNTGSSDFLVFALEQPVEVAPVQYATLDDINKLREEIEALKNPGKAGKKNDADE